jgi:thymidylate synthase
MLIKARNVNAVFPLGIMYLNKQGEKRDSRNGPTLEIMEPTIVTYQCPDERVLFSPERDANPFFHLFESLWMLAGRADVAFLDQYNKGMSQYSDDGISFNAPYGYRLRHTFGYDQLDDVIRRLRTNPDDRRVVLQIHDPSDSKLRPDSRDHACNLSITPRIRHGKLDWTVFNRSNDYVFGMTGANVVHMSIIQEYVASMIGIKVGSYSQITNCLHAYTDNPVWKRVKNLPVVIADSYKDGEVKSFQLVTYPSIWGKELREWMECPWSGRKYEDPFFEQVAKPMAIAHRAHKENKDGLKFVGAISASDWRKACTEWLERRENV